MIESIPGEELVHVMTACPALSVKACLGQPVLGPVFRMKSRQKFATLPPRAGAVTVAVMVCGVPTDAEVSVGFRETA